MISRMKSLASFFAPWIAVASLAGALQIASAAEPVKTYNIREFGAKGDGVTKDTVAIQKALDTCAVNGGGEVVVPAGKYLSGSVQIGYRTTLRLEKDSIITGSPDLDDYPLIDIRWEGRWQPGHRSLIYAANVDHIGIVGPGLLEGNPTTAASNRPPRGTLVVEPINCTDVHWEGFFVRQTGNNWATHPTYCTDVVIKNVNIYGGRDGIDVDSCKNVVIDTCTIDSGDDSVSIKSGRGMDGARIGRPTEDVLITHCTMTGRRFACIGIGSEISAGVRNLRIEHCTFSARTDAIYLKTRIGRAGVNENITGEDLDIIGGNFLRVNLTRGGNLNTNDDPVEGLIGYPSARNLSFNNIRLKDVTTVANVTEVAPEKPVENLTLSHITGNATKGISMIHVKNAVLKDIAVTGVNGTFLATDDVTGTGLEGATKYVAPPSAPAPARRGPPPAAPEAAPTVPGK
jgi:polygalacturonase